MAKTIFAMPAAPGCSASPLDPNRGPLLTGDDARAANAAVEAIARDLRAVDPGAVPADLAAGAAGIAVFFAYLSQARPDGDGATDQEEAQDWLEAGIYGLRSRPQPPDLLGGFTGIGWAAAHLCDDETAAKLCQIVNERLLSLLASPTDEAHYDLVSGLVGFGTYALAAPPCPQRDRLLATVLDRLEPRAVADAGGLAWFTPPALLPTWQRAICPDGHYNLGLAHGIPGVIGLLAGCVAAGVEARRATRLLEGAIAWILAAAPARKDGRFPAWRGRGAPDQPARLAWCYGDPGVAVSLVAAARACGRDDWEAEARDLALLMARRPPEHSGIMDGGICHGAAGLGHIFHRLGRAMREPELLEAARSWFRQLCTQARPGEGIGGFLAHHPDAVPAFRPDGGLLNGSAGIGLSLLAALTPDEPAWDQVLLLGV